MDASTTRFPGTMGPHTGAAVARLRDGQPGDTVTREELAKVIGRDCEVGGDGYPNVLTAIKHVEKNHAIVWRWSKTLQAWKCLSPAECVDESRAAISVARRRARRGLVVANAVDVRKLTAEEQQQHNVTCIALQMTEMCSSGRVTKKLATADMVRIPNATEIVALMERAP